MNSLAAQPTSDASASQPSSNIKNPTNLNQALEDIWGSAPYDPNVVDDDEIYEPSTVAQSFNGFWGTKADRRIVMADDESEGFNVADNNGMPEPALSADNEEEFEDDEDFWADKSAQEDHDSAFTAVDALGVRGEAQEVNPDTLHLLAVSHNGRLSSSKTHDISEVKIPGLTLLGSPPPSPTSASVPLIVQSEPLVVCPTPLVMSSGLSDPTPQSPTSIHQDLAPQSNESTRDGTAPAKKNISKPTTQQKEEVYSIQLDQNDPFFLHYHTETHELYACSFGAGENHFSMYAREPGVWDCVYGDEMEFVWNGPVPTYEMYEGIMGTVASHASGILQSNFQTDANKIMNRVLAIRTQNQAPVNQALILIAPFHHINFVGNPVHSKNLEDARYSLFMIFKGSKYLESETRLREGMFCSRLISRTDPVFVSANMEYLLQLEAQGADAFFRGLEGKVFRFYPSLDPSDQSTYGTWVYEASGEERIFRDPMTVYEYESLEREGFTVFSGWYLSRFQTESRTRSSFWTTTSQNHKKRECLGYDNYNAKRGRVPTRSQLSRVTNVSGSEDSSRSLTSEEEAKFWSSGNEASSDTTTEDDSRSVEHVNTKYANVRIHHPIPVIRPSGPRNELELLRADTPFPAGDGTAFNLKEKSELALPVLSIAGSEKLQRLGDTFTSLCAPYAKQANTADASPNMLDEVGAQFPNGEDFAPVMMAPRAELSVDDRQPMAEVDLHHPYINSSEDDEEEEDEFGEAIRGSRTEKRRIDALRVDGLRRERLLSASALNEEGEQHEEAQVAPESIEDVVVTVIEVNAFTAATENDSHGFRVPAQELLRHSYPTPSPTPSAVDCTEAKYERGADEYCPRSREPEVSHHLSITKKFTGNFTGDDECSHSEVDSYDSDDEYESEFTRPLDPALLPLFPTDRVPAVNAETYESEAESEDYDLDDFTVEIATPATFTRPKIVDIKALSSSTPTSPQEGLAKVTIEQPSRPAPTPFQEPPKEKVKSYWTKLRTQAPIPASPSTPSTPEKSKKSFRNSLKKAAWKLAPWALRPMGM